MAERPFLPRWPTLNHERELDGRVCGIDEAGCAPIAGPVVAAAVVLPPGPKPRALRGLTDSKLLRAEQRERFSDIIRRLAEVGVGVASVEEIDRLNIFHADMLAMQRAVADLPSVPDFALADGRATPVLPCPARALVKGDRRSLSIAAASVVAKVTRDRVMRELAAHYPDYGWDTNVGYGTDRHYLGLLRKGPTDHHRRSFAPLTTLFGAGGAGLGRFRFQAARGPAALARLEVLELRRDLHAVFDAAGLHLGVVKNRRGCWIFQAVGYGDSREPLPGAGPCAAWHGHLLPDPGPDSLIRLLTGLPPAGAR